MHPCWNEIFFLYFQLTELSLSPRSPPLLEHQRANADKNRLCVNRGTQERRAHCNNKFVNLLWSSSVMVFVSVYQVPTLLPFLWAISEVQQNTGASSELQQGVMPLWVRSLLDLTGPLKYLLPAADQTLALNIVLYMHYTEGLIINGELNVISMYSMSWHLLCQVYTNEL